MAGLPLAALKMAQFNEDLATMEGIDILKVSGAELIPLFRRPFARRN